MEVLRYLDYIDMRRTGIWQKVTWLLLLILWLPTMVYAGNDMENSSYWMITLSGVNGVDIQIPVYDSGGLDGFVDHHVPASATGRHPCELPKQTGLDVCYH